MIKMEWLPGSDGSVNIKFYNVHLKLIENLFLEG